MIGPTVDKLSQTGQRVREHVQDNPNLWRAERDIWAVGIVIVSVLAWFDINPPEVLSFALAYLLIRVIQLSRRTRK